MKHRTWIACLCAALLLFSGAAFTACSTRQPPQEPEPPAFSADLRISEVMGKNRATLLDASGRFSDWAELENQGSQAIDLSGWSLSDREGEARLPLPETSLGPGEFLLLFLGGEADTQGFSLSENETLFLLAPSLETMDRVLWSVDGSDVSLARQPDGRFTECVWPSPGYPNTKAGYAAFCGTRTTAGPLVINEVMTANNRYAIQPGMEAEDWVELKNISDETVSLAGWHLSDNRKDYALFSLPEIRLDPGECVLIYCSGDEALSIGSYYHANFSLNAASEELYLTDSTGALVDFVHLHDIPANGSMGRMEGENGFFYFLEPSPGQDNTAGARTVSEKPVALTPDGVFNDTRSVTLELDAPGQIYYTTNGYYPTVDSTPYTGPIPVENTSIIRAIAVEEGALPSDDLVCSYIINENHTLPVLSLVIDDLAEFDEIYRYSLKDVTISANLALYDGEHSFNHPCGLSMKGWTSLSLPKKSLGASFSGVYGGNLDCDVFGNGITQYSSLSIRAGQDYTTSIFRNELFQNLLLEMGDKAYSQESKYCVLYINGEYWGIYCLKEDFSRQYYASHNRVSKDSVTMYRTPTALSSDFFQDVVQFGWYQALSDEGNYQHFCDLVDIDSLIDWFIIEGYSANTDVQGNARVFRSTETDGKWQFAAYDFDWAFYYSGSDFSTFLEQGGNVGNQLPPIVNQLLLYNRDFRARFLARFSELNKTILSNEHVLEKIDELQALLEPEAERDRIRWDLNPDSWYAQVERLRHFITDYNWAEHNVDQLIWLINLTSEEQAKYFDR